MSRHIQLTSFKNSAVFWPAVYSNTADHARVNGDVRPIRMMFCLRSGLACVHRMSTIYCVHAPFPHDLMEHVRQQFTGSKAAAWRGGALSRHRKLRIC